MALPTVADRSKSECAWEAAPGTIPRRCRAPVGEAMKFVHDDGRNIAEIEVSRMQEAIEQDFRDYDEDACLRIDAAVAGDQADVRRP